MLSLCKLIVTTLLFSAFSASADEAAVRRMVAEQARGQGQIESVTKAPWGDLYEVALRGPNGPLIYYVDSAASVIFAGQVLDAKSGRNLTEEALEKLARIKWESLPFESAITTVHGKGRRKIAVFSDPNCPFCKRFESDLAKLDDLTVHVFLYPVIKPQSVTQSKSVWCSKDRAKAWDDLLLRGIQPTAKPDCDTPVEKLLALGRTLGANSTPTWFLQNGERHKGIMPIKEVIRRLDAATAAQH